jgi:hypothetical protein
MFRLKIIRWFKIDWQFLRLPTSLKYFQTTVFDWRKISGFSNNEISRDDISKKTMILETNIDFGDEQRLGLQSILQNWFDPESVTQYTTMSSTPTPCVFNSFAFRNYCCRCLPPFKKICFKQSSLLYVITCLLYQWASCRRYVRYIRGVPKWFWSSD